MHACEESEGSVDSVGSPLGEGRVGGGGLICCVIFFF